VGLDIVKLVQTIQVVVVAVPVAEEEKTHHLIVLPV
jgi:hypothetical protein